MSGFDLAELLPFYLDETDEHIAGLNDSLLRLEQDPTDAKALQEAFRMFHSIKGSSVVMGFKPVNQLTHHMESLFEQFRSKKRVLDRPALDLTFRCLDELRDYHRDLRSQGQSDVDLSGLTALVEAALHTTVAATGTSAAAAPQPAPRPEVAEVAAARPAPASLFEEPSGTELTVVFEANLPLADMKARLVLNRLSSRVRVLRTDPPVERLDDVESLPRFTVFLVADCDMDELRALADVEGVAQVRIKSIPQAGLESEPSIPQAAAGLTRTSGAIPASPAVAPTAQAPRDEPQPPAEAMTVTASPAPDPTPPEVSEAAEAETGVEAEAAATSATPTPGGPKTGGPKKARIVETIRVESDRLDHLMNLAGELVITKARFVAISRGLEELFRGSNAHSLASDARERLDSVTRGLETLAAIKAGSGSATSERSTDRWSAHVRRLREDFRAIQDELVLIREAREQIKALAEAIHSLGRVSDGLQKGVLDTRMVPIGPLFERFRRVIRDLSHSSGKEVLLQIGGEKTELDKRMIDELSDPLIHMVRNAVDHGLESPAEREAAGKPRRHRLAPGLAPRQQRGDHRQ